MSCGTCGLQASNTMQGDTGVPAGAPSTSQQPRCPHCHAFVAPDHPVCNNAHCPGKRGPRPHNAAARARTTRRPAPARPHPASQQALQQHMLQQAERTLQTVRAAKHAVVHYGLPGTQQSLDKAQQSLAAARAQWESLPVEMRPARAQMLLHQAAAELAAKHDQYAPTLAAYRKALTVARRLHDQDAQAHLLMQLGSQYEHHGRPDQAAPPYWEASQIYRAQLTTPPTLHDPAVSAMLQALNKTAQMTRHSEDPAHQRLFIAAQLAAVESGWLGEEALAATAEVVQAAQRLAEPDLLAQALAARSDTLQWAIDAARTAQHYSRVCELADAWEETASAQGIVGLPLQQVRLQRAQYYIMAALSKHGTTTDVNIARRGLTQILASTSDPDSPEIWRLRGETATLLADLESLSAQPATARDYGQVAVQAYNQSGDLAKEATARSSLAIMHLQAGAPAQAEQEFHQSIRLHEQAHAVRGQVTTILLYAQFLLDQGQPSRAAAQERWGDEVSRLHGLDAAELRDSVQQVWQALFYD